MNRIVKPEILDTLPPGDPHAIHSRRDLRHVNFWMGNHNIMANALKKNISSAPKKVIEIGAGDGNFLLRVAKNLKWQNVEAILLDRQKIISPETVAAFQAVGWQMETIAADVFDWLKIENSGGDIVIANLFLHHFEDPRLAELLRKISERAKLFVAVEPQRFAFPFFCGQLLRLIGCNQITRHDAEVSVCAGFLCDEISGLWPDKKNWRLTERRSGLFSHLFIAKKFS